MGRFDVRIVNRIYLVRLAGWTAIRHTALPTDDRRPERCEYVRCGLDGNPGVESHRVRGVREPVHILPRTFGDGSQVPPQLVAARKLSMTSRHRGRSN